MGSCHSRNLVGRDARRDSAVSSMYSMMQRDFLGELLAIIGKDRAEWSTPELIDEGVAAILADNPTDDVAVLAAGVVAQAGREEERRLKFSTATLDALCIIYLRESLDEVGLHHLNRGIGNLLVDNEPQRIALLEHDAALDKIMANISSQDEDLAHSSISVLINLVMDFPRGQQKVVEKKGIPLLLKRIENGTLSRPRALQLLSVLVQNEYACDKLVSLSGIDLLLDCLPAFLAEPDENLEHAIEILETASENGIVQKRLYARQVHLVLLEEMEKLVNQEINVDDDDYTPILDACLKVVVNMTHNDEVVQGMITEKATLGKFRGWMTYPGSILSGKAEDLVMCACLCIGNLARSDKNAASLVNDHQFAKYLLQVLNDCNSLKVQVATLSALRHMCIPAENKAYLGHLSVLEAVIPYLKSPTPDVVLTSTVILRHLSSEDRNMRAVIYSNSGDGTALSAALEAAEKHADTPAIQCEVGRLLAILIKTAAKSNAIDPLIKVCSNLAPVWNLLTLPYPTVYGEAILALSLVFAHYPTPADIAVPESFATAASELFQPTLPAAVRANAAQLLLVVQTVHSEWAGRFDDVAQAALGNLAQEAVDMDAAIYDQLTTVLGKIVAHASSE
ncbi:hypothetical protein GGF31_005547 [Allomyces arbusculus]|nr:hypothetical protein GGF31_005547 [Allomyces arbusculus]